MISIIAARAKNGVIGCKGRIPWDIPEDRAHFREVTYGCPVIMGRHTYEEIGRPLPGRFNIIVSGSISLSGENVITTTDLKAAVRCAKLHIENKGCRNEIFLCGGERIYREGLSIAQRIYLTDINECFEGDAYFPEFGNEFRLVMYRRLPQKGIKFSIYER